MNNEVYESPYISRVVVFLEHAIAGSIDVNTGNGSFEESWDKIDIDQGEIELI